MSDASLPLLLLVFLLGLRHGLDPDHIAIVDGLTCRAATQAFARRAGLLFSLGHGLLVTTVAILASTTPAWTTPAWLDTAGAVLAIAFLAGTGLVQLRRAVGAQGITGPSHPGPGWLRALGHPALAGALFAVSFDTLSQAAAFAREGGIGWPQALGLGLAFTLGMMVTDGVNGLCIARLLARARRGARRVCVITLAIAVSSLFIAATGLLRLLAPAWTTGPWQTPMLLSGGITLFVALAYGYVQWSYRRIPEGAGRMKFVRQSDSVDDWRGEK